MNKYIVTLNHQNEKYRRELTFYDYDLAEKHFNVLVKPLLEELGNFELLLVSNDDRVLLRLQKTL